MDEIGQDVASAIAQELIDARVVQSMAIHAVGNEMRKNAWKAVLANKFLWSLREDGAYSVQSMGHADLRACILEDMLFVRSLEKKGAAAFYPFRMLFKHLDVAETEEMRARIISAFNSLVSDGMVEIKQGNVSLVPGQQQNAEDECGVIFADEADGEVHDTVDKLLLTGGSALLAEQISEMMMSVGDMNEIEPTSPMRP